MIFETGMEVRLVRIADGDVVWLRSILEAYDGLACLSGYGTGIVRLITPLNRIRELDSLLNDISDEIELARLK